MIAPEMFNLGELVAAVLESNGNEGAWRQYCEIIPRYMPPFPSPDTRPRCVVRCGESFLRHSKGPRQGHGWDVYGDDYITPELAIIALGEAGPPPNAWWGELVHAHRKAENR